MAKKAKSKTKKKKDTKRSQKNTIRYITKSISYQIQKTFRQQQKKKTAASHMPPKRRVCIRTLSMTKATGPYAMTCETFVSWEAAARERQGQSITNL